MKSGAAIQTFLLSAIIALPVFMCARMAGAQTLPPPDSPGFIKSAEMVFLTFDQRTGSPFVRVDRGSANGIKRGSEFLVFIDGKLSGTFTADSVLNRACAGLLRNAPPVPSQSLPLTVDLVPQTLPGQSALVPRLSSIPGDIALPRGGGLTFPWRAEYDTGLNQAFRTVAGGPGAAPRTAPPPPPDTPAPPFLPPAVVLATSAPLPGEISAAPADIFRVRELDPDMAREIKSGFFVEPGDCIHVAPWPGEPSGRFIELGQDMTIVLPGPRFVSADRKSLLRIEKELRDIPPGNAGATVSPCVKSGQTMQPNPD